MSTYPRSREEARAGVPDFDARVDALRPFRQPGQQYVRRVHDELVSAYRQWDAESVGAFLVTAEIAAGLRPTDDYLNRYDETVWGVSPDADTARETATR